MSAINFNLIDMLPMQRWFFKNIFLNITHIDCSRFFTQDELSYLKCMQAKKKIHINKQPPIMPRYNNNFIDTINNK